MPSCDPPTVQLDADHPGRAASANTLIVVVALYAGRSLRLDKTEQLIVVVLTILAAVPAGIVWGRVVDRLGPRRTLDIVLVLWMVVFATAAAIPVLGLPSQLIYVTGVAIGIGIAGLWSADRPLMARLAPPRYYGQFFGLYSMVGRFAAIVGPTMGPSSPIPHSWAGGSRRPSCSSCYGWSSRSLSCARSTTGHGPGDPRTCRVMPMTASDHVRRSLQDESLKAGAIGPPSRLPQRPLTLS